MARIRTSNKVGNSGSDPDDPNKDVTLKDLYKAVLGISNKLDKIITKDNKISGVEAIQNLQNEISKGIKDLKSSVNQNTNNKPNTSNSMSEKDKAVLEAINLSNDLKRQRYKNNEEREKRREQKEEERLKRQEQREIEKAKKEEERRLKEEQRQIEKEKREKRRVEEEKKLKAKEYEEWKKQRSEYYKQTIAYKVGSNIASQKSSSGSAMILSMLTGGLVNPVIAKTLGLDKLVSAGINWTGRKLGNGIGKTTHATLDAISGLGMGALGGLNLMRNKIGQVADDRIKARHLKLAQGLANETDKNEIPQLERPRIAGLLPYYPSNNTNSSILSSLPTLANEQESNNAAAKDKAENSPFIKTQKDILQKVTEMLNFWRDKKEPEEKKEEQSLFGKIWNGIKILGGHAFNIIKSLFNPLTWFKLLGIAALGKGILSLFNGLIHPVDTVKKAFKSLANGVSALNNGFKKINLKSVIEGLKFLGKAALKLGAEFAAFEIGRFIGKVLGLDDENTYLGKKVAKAGEWAGDKAYAAYKWWKGDDGLLKGENLKKAQEKLTTIQTKQSTPQTSISEDIGYTPISENLGYTPINTSNNQNSGNYKTYIVNGIPAISMKDLNLNGEIVPGVNSSPYIAPSNIENLKTLDKTISSWGYDIKYTSAMGGSHAGGPKSHAAGQKVDLQLWKNGKPTRMTKGQENALILAGFAKNGTGALGWEPVRGQVLGGHYDYFIGGNNKGNVTLADNLKLDTQDMPTTAENQYVAMNDMNETAMASAEANANSSGGILDMLGTIGNSIDSGFGSMSSGSNNDGISAVGGAIGGGMPGIAMNIPNTNGGAGNSTGSVYQFGDVAKTPILYTL